ncbi:MAG: hypothetical protein FWD84_03060 [Oscillospiraceae bacterium]|nr:hypothetical protein [Oscillospiraceae bacterium]
MENRNPLEILGPKNQLLRVDNFSVVHIDERGQERRISIADIQKVQVSPPELWPGIFHNGVIGFTATHARKTFFGVVPDLVFYLKHPDELPYAQNIEKYILEFQANQSEDV